MTQFRNILNYIKYKALSRHKKGFGIHSPFLYNFIRNVLIATDNTDDSIKDLKLFIRSKKKSKDKIHVKSQGEKSRVFKDNSSFNIGTVIKKSSLPEKYGLLLNRLVKYFHCKNIIEMGTSVGISAIYMACNNANTHIYTIDNDTHKIEIAKDFMKECSLDNIHLIKGTFQDRLSEILKKLGSIDLLFFDGDHHEERTIKYFAACLPYIKNNSIIIIDDINWSNGMRRAWRKIKQHSETTLTVDIHRLGIIFFKKELSKENFIIRF